MFPPEIYWKNFFSCKRKPSWAIHEQSEWIINHVSFIESEKSQPARCYHASLFADCQPLSPHTLPSLPTSAQPSQLKVFRANFQFKFPGFLSVDVKAVATFPHGLCGGFVFSSPPFATCQPPCPVSAHLQ